MYEGSFQIYFWRQGSIVALWCYFFTVQQNESAVLTIKLELKVKVKFAQLCLTLCDPMDYTVHGILQANTGAGSLSLLQGIFPTQGLNWGLLHCRQVLYQLSYQGSPTTDGQLKCLFVLKIDTTFDSVNLMTPKRSSMLLVCADNTGCQKSFKIQ